jgi:Uma2 family endonuclease
MLQRRYEILDRIPQTVPLPGTRHQSVSLKLASALLLHVEPRSLGHVLQSARVVLSREVVIQPDILFLRKGRIGLVGESSLQGPPDIIIEILSPETRENDLNVKRKIYSRFEVMEYWVADLCSEKIEVLLWSELGYATAGIYGKPDRVRSPALPGFTLPLRRIFGNAARV